MITIMQKMENLTPNRDELLEGTEFKCSEPNCMGTFKCQSNLTLHLIKVHKKNDVSLSSSADTEIHFFCPEESCMYNLEKNVEEGTNHFFSGLKQLKQHFVKVHKERTLPCKNCGKSFSDEATHRRHEKSCGFKIFCAICGSTYRNQPSLVYHIKTKQHVFTWSDFDDLAAEYGLADDEGGRKKSGKRKHQAIQTEAKNRGVSTQTSRTKKKQKLPEGATDGARDSVHTVEVQTLPFLEYDFAPFLMDSASQTTLPSSSHTHTQTERDVFLSDAQDDSTDMLLFNHIHTQTTNEEILSEFSDIQTQTQWDTDFDLYSDFLVSTETQTPRVLHESESASTYTQTIDFLGDYTSSHTQT